MAKTKLKTTNIKGKEYVEVNERIKYFREHEPDGSIITEMVSNENGVCIFKANVIVEGNVRATGYAYEKEGSTFINKTSYIENCETSAIGRALGIYGIGIDGSVASAEEVKNAINNQSPDNQKAVKAMTGGVPKGKVQEALDALQQAFAEKDFAKADAIKDWALKNDVAQVYDRHEMLFKQK